MANKKTGPGVSERRPGRSSKAGVPEAAARGVPKRAAKGAAPPPGVEAIYDRILTAIHERRLPPGVQLVEERLGAIFGVSRTLIRHAIARLAHDGIVTLHRNRGAFVSSPTVAETRAVFEARRLLEPWLAAQLAAHATPAQIKRLREAVEHESQARAANDRRAIVRLSGDFHQVLADMAGNVFLARSMRELISLTCLAIVLYDSPGVPACPYHEHGDLIDAIERGDGAEAARRMVEHLNHVQATLDLREEEKPVVDLEAALA
ncbi:MAG TPA: GntR family transcriptional regulator [Burkholderiaceae bacterium]|nr:GntR family transcriptional regulator [Burkholderiaceae bacterium]